MKSYMLRKRNGKYEYVPIELSPQLPEGRKKFNHCGECGSEFFREHEFCYVCKKCRTGFSKQTWEYVK